VVTSLEKKSGVSWQIIAKKTSCGGTNYKRIIMAQSKREGGRGGKASFEPKGNLFMLQMDMDQREVF